MTLCASITQPLRADAHSAGESDAAIDDEDAAMTAVVALPEAEGAEEDERIQRSKGGHLAAGARHRVSVLRRDQGGPEAVQQDVGLDSGAAAFRQRLRDLHADRALLIEVLGVCNRLARRADGFERGREDLIAVQQHVNRVAGVGRRGIGLQREEERRVRRRQLRKLVVGLHPSA